MLLSAINNFALSPANNLNDDYNNSDYSYNRILIRLDLNQFVFHVSYGTFSALFIFDDIVCRI